MNHVKVPDATVRRAVRSDPSIESVLVPIECARRLVELEHHQHTASTYFRDDQTVITTTTVHDDTLKDLSWERELDIVRRFAPDYHVPTEYSVYEETMSPAEQAAAILDSMGGTEWFAERLGNHPTEVLVQAKGWRDWHFRLCIPTMKRLGTDFVVFYATGYKARVEQPASDIETLVSVLNPDGILVLGQQSTRFLSRAPPEVNAAAGCRWRKKSGLRDGCHEPARHAAWKADVEDELGSGQAIIDSYTTTKVTENG